MADLASGWRNAPLATVVSAAAMMLQEHGAPPITQPAGDFLPEHDAARVAIAGGNEG